MKNKFFALAILAIGMTSTASAQNSATNNEATASATIVTPISIAKAGDMNFGSIVASTAGGTVVLSVNGQASATGVTLFAGSNGAITTAAAFTIGGEANYGYSITLPADGEVVLSNGTTEMSLSTFIHNATGTFGAENETFQVGATLNVGANQAAGAYVSTPFAVTVAYN